MARLDEITVELRADFSRFSRAMDEVATRFALMWYAQWIVRDRLQRMAAGYFG